MQENKKLIIARLTGYGQTGPLAHKAGHDINYVALSGFSYFFKLFYAILGLLPYVSGDRKPYWPPANLLADFAGGSLLSAFAIVCLSLYSVGLQLYTKIYVFVTVFSTFFLTKVSKL